MDWEFEIGDKVAGTEFWMYLTSERPGTVKSRGFDQYDSYYYYDIEYTDSYKRVQQCRYEGTNLRLVGDPLPVFHAEIISVGAGRALYSFRAADAAEANEKVTGLIKGTSTGPSGETLQQMMGCKNPPKGWEERIIVMYIKQVR